MLINGGHQQLFDQAIIESGTTGYTLPYMSEKTQGFERVLSEVGCDQTEEVIKCLQKLPADVLANNTLTNMVDPFPLVDKVLLKEQPLVSFAEGRFSKIPLMIGTCTNEVGHCQVIC